MSEVLSIDIGGSHVKVRIPSDPEKRRFTSGPDLTPQQMVDGVKTCIEGWDIDRVSIGIPAPIRKNTAVIDPVNLGSGWAGFDFSDAFGFPTRVTNDAAMQAIGSYEGGSMLFMGLGTGLGTCLINQYVVQPTEIAHMPYRMVTPSRTWSARPVLKRSARRHGVRKSARSRRSSTTPCSRTTSFSVVGTARSSRPMIRCPSSVVEATTQTPSKAAFGCGFRNGRGPRPETQALGTSQGAR